MFTEKLKAFFAKVKESFGKCPCFSKGKPAETEKK